jgi:hypothetical protein
MGVADCADVALMGRSSASDGKVADGGKCADGG